MPIGKSNSEIKMVNGQMISAQTQFSETYKEACFISWYNAGRPRGKHLRAAMSVDEYDRIPNEQVLFMWRRENGWDARADDLDRKAMKIVERRSVEKRAAMFERYAEIGEQMAELGIEFLQKDHAIVKASDAVKAIIEGYKLEKENLGSAEFAQKIAKMTDEELKKRADELLERFVKLPEGEEVITTEYEEVED